MKARLLRRFTRENPDYSNLEARLEQVLEPIQPRDAYVRELRASLMRGWGDLPRKTPLGTKNILLIIGAGLLSGLLVITLSIRAVAAMVAMFGLFYHMRNPNKEPRHTGFPPPAF